MIEKLIKFCLNWWVMYWLNSLLTFLFIDYLALDFHFWYLLVMALLSVYWFISSSLFVFNKKPENGLYLRYVLALLSFNFINYLLVVYFYSLFGWINKYLLIFFVFWFITLIKFFVYDRLVFNTKKW